MKKLVFSLIVAATVLCALDARSAIPGHDDMPIRSKLYQTSRARLAMARAQGARTFSVMLASATGKNGEVATAITALGGKIDWRADEVDYLRATLPIDAVETLAERDDVVAIDANSSVAVLSPTPVPTTSTAPDPSATPVLRTTTDEAPLLHPYLPGRDIGTLALRTVHPTYDGRGITVAVVDGTPDFLLPELRYGRTIDGTLVPKYVDIRTAEDPKNPEDQYSVFVHTQPVHAINGTFTVKGISYRTPHDGDFRFVSLTTKKTYYSYYWKQFHSDTKFGKNEVLFSVLWDEQSGTVWVDIDHPGDFSKANGLRDYHLNHDYGTFSIQVKDPQARKSMGYVVQTDVATQKLAVLIGAEGHPSGSSGSIAANRYSGGRIEGIAPGARLYAITPSETGDFSVLDAVITAARNPQVDIIDLEIISALSYAPKDGRFTEDVIFDRVVRTFEKPIVDIADNDFGMEQVSESCNPTPVLCVGAYENRDSYRINAGIDVPQRDNLHFVDSFGPTGTGELKPDILAPSGWISLTPGSGLSEHRALKGVYDLPPGYQIFGGTSQAAPTAAGAIAVLLSAARQQGLHVTPQRLIAAVTHTARYLGNLPAYVQGNGLMQVDAAFRWLQQHDSRLLTHLTFDAPVRTQTSWMSSKPNRGVGLFEREGWIAGKRDTRTLFITRDSGSVSPQIAGIELIGNDGTFTGPSHILLPRNHAVAIQIGIAPKQSGAHSAILRLRSQTGEWLGETLLTVAAAEQFTSSNGFTITHHLSVPRPGETSFFVTVPKGTQVLVVRITSPRKELEYNAILPDSTQSLNVSNNLLVGFPLFVGTREDVFPHPQPGTWEIIFMDVSNDFTFETRHVHPTPVTVTAAIAGATMGHLPSLTVTTQPASITTHTNVIPTGRQQVYTIHVPKNATGVGAQLTSAPGSYLNMYLLDCTKPAHNSETRKASCILVTKSTEASAQQYLYDDRPAPGLWKLVVDGYLASPHGTPYRLVNYSLAGVPMLGSVPARTFGTLGNDPSIYYNDLGVGEIKPRDGLNPIIFDVRLLTTSVVKPPEP